MEFALSSRLKIAAIRTGTEPLRKLPIHSFERVLDTALLCPRCGVAYNLVVDWDEAADRWFPETSRPLIRLLSKAIHMGHGNDHRVSHFETAGVVVESVTG